MMQLVAGIANELAELATGPILHCFMSYVFSPKVLLS